MTFFDIKKSLIWKILPFERSTFCLFYLLIVLPFVVLPFVVLPYDRSSFCHSTFCNSTFCNSTFCNSTFCTWAEGIMYLALYIMYPCFTLVHEEERIQGRYVPDWAHAWHRCFWCKYLLNPISTDMLNYISLFLIRREGSHCKFKLPLISTKFDLKYAMMCRQWGYLQFLFCLKR